MSNIRWIATTLGLLVAALMMSLALVIFAASIACSPGFLKIVTDPYIQVQDYAFSLNHADCDIVIYGDSSAMTGYDPAVIEQQTHLKTCNISQEGPVVVILGTLPLDLYLSKNTRPKYLVFQLAPQSLFYRHRWDQSSTFESIVLLLRHRSGAYTNWAMLIHPLESVRFAKKVLLNKYAPDRPRLASFRQSYTTTISDYFSHRGMLTMPLPPNTHCQYASVPLMFPESANPVNTEWIRSLRERYTSEQTKVLINITPIPDCDLHTQFYKQQLSPYVDVNVQTMPISFFNSSDRHFTTEGSRLTTLALAQQIEALEKARNSR